MIFGSSAPFHILSYACLTGTTIWHSYVSSPMAFKTLSRSHFGLLQSQLFPIYFSVQSVLGGLCLLTTSNRKARILFAINVVGGLINRFVLEPRTRRIMIERAKLESSEGKQYNDVGISDQMKAVNKQFGRIHQLSVIINLVASITLVVYPFMLPPMNL